MPRWFVEVSPLDAEASEERYCVEADQWQQALQIARKLRGDRGPLSRVTIEITDAGYRAVDPAVRLRYVVAKAPDDAELTEGAAALPLGPESLPPPAIEPAPVLLGARLIRERAEEPTEALPITYREYAYAVAPWTTAEELRIVADQLFAQAARALSERAQGKFVLLALFDHVFESKPERLPMATLTWKDWQGDPVFQLGAPASASAAPAPGGSEPPRPVLEETLESAFEALERREAGGPSPQTLPSPADVPSVPERAAPSPEQAPAAAPGQRPKAPQLDIPRAPRAPAVTPDRNVAARGEPSPARDGQASAPGPAARPEGAQEAVRASEPPPLSQKLASVIPPSHEQRVRRGSEEDLLGELFERMAELAFCPDLVSGVDLVLVTLWELLPCEGTLVHVYDIDRRAFVVVRAAGPTPERAIMHRTPEDDPLLQETLRSEGVFRSDQAGADPRFQTERWAKLGVTPTRALCAAVQQGPRLLGAIELANPITPAPFYDTEESGLLYTCEHLADFIANRPLVLDDDVVIPKA